MDLKNMQAKMGFFGVGKKGSTDSSEAKSTIGLIKSGLASAFTGSAVKVDSTTKNNKSEKTVFAIKTASSCTEPSESVCMNKYPKTCTANVALSTVATVGATIAALAMSF